MVKSDGRCECVKVDTQHFAYRKLSRIIGALLPVVIPLLPEFFSLFLSLSFSFLSFSLSCRMILLSKHQVTATNGEEHHCKPKRDGGGGGKSSSSSTT
jgi:hypothetical protein